MSFFKKLFGEGDTSRKEETKNIQSTSYEQSEKSYQKEKDDEIEEVTRSDSGKNKNNPNSLYQNVEGKKKDEYMDYIYEIDAMNWHNYDYTKWPCADLTFPDLEEDKKYDLWPYKPDLNQAHWVDLNNQFKSGLRRQGFLLGYKTPDQYVGKDAQECLVEFEALAKGDSEDEISSAGFKDKKHLAYIIESTRAEIKKAYAEAQKILDESSAKLNEEMNANIETAKAGGLLDPIKGVSMEDWAAANAKISGGLSLEEVLKVLGVEKPIWDEVSAEWMARMTQDTTFAISKVYGDAFTNPNIGKFASAGGSPVAAGGNEAVEKIKNDFEGYIKIMCHQNVAATQGIDANAILQQYGLTAADWGMIGMHWAPQMGTNLELATKMSALMDKYNAEFATNTAPKAGDDIDF